MFRELECRRDNRCVKEAIFKHIDRTISNIWHRIVWGGIITKGVDSYKGIEY